MRIKGLLTVIGAVAEIAWENRDKIKDAAVNTYNKWGGEDAQRRKVHKEMVDALRSGDPNRIARAFALHERVRPKDPDGGKGPNQKSD